MSERGQRDWVRWSMAMVAGWLVATGVLAQQTPGRDDSQGGFVVIEDSSPPPPPPKALVLPTTTLPVKAPGSAATYKPGSAVYAIPWAKPGAKHVEQSPPAAIGRVAIPPAHLPLKPIQPKPPAKPVEPTWVTEGPWLRPALAEWAKRAGWGIRWIDSTGKPTETDRHLDAPLRFTGDFANAVRQCIELYARKGDHLVYDVYPNSKMIIVTETN